MIVGLFDTSTSKYWTRNEGFIFGWRFPIWVHINNSDGGWSSPFTSSHSALQTASKCRKTNCICILTENPNQILWLQSVEQRLLLPSFWWTFWVWLELTREQRHPEESWVLGGCPPPRLFYLTAFLCFVAAGCLQCHTNSTINRMNSPFMKPLVWTCSMRQENESSRKQNSLEDKSLLSVWEGYCP